MVAEIDAFLKISSELGVVFFCDCDLFIGCPSRPSELDPKVDTSLGDCLVFAPQQSVALRNRETAVTAISSCDSCNR